MRRLEFLTAMIACTCCGFLQDPVASKKVEDAVKEAGPPSGILFSKDTTYVTGPVRSDGRIDYVAAINQRVRQGVTKENNAVRILAQAGGFEAAPPGTRKQFFQELGLEVPSGQQGFKKWEIQPSRETRTVYRETWQDEQIRAAFTKPWKKADAPTISAWLDSNERSLKLVADAVTKDHYFAPYYCVDPEPAIINCQFAMASFTKELAVALVCRSMRKFGEGDQRGAFEDLGHVRRLAQLVSQGPFLLESVFAFSLEEFAMQGESALLMSGKLIATEAAEHSKRISTIAIPSAMSRKIDQTERLMVLDCICLLYHFGEHGFEQIMRKGKIEQNIFAKMKTGFENSGIDWSEVLRQANSDTDRLVEIVALPEIADRVRAFEKLHLEAQAFLKDIAGSRLKFANQLRLEGKTQKQAEAAAYGRHYFHRFTPYPLKAVLSEPVAQSRREVSRLAFAVAAYVSRHSKPPTQLSELSPTYLTRIPRDPFSNRDYQLRQDKGMIVLYSVGPNATDDSGECEDCDLQLIGSESHEALVEKRLDAVFADRKANRSPPKDDIAIRIKFTN